MQQHRAANRPDYDEDFFSWTQHQAKLLRAFGKLRPDAPEGIDFEHVAEEIEDLGRADLHSVKSLVRQILVHLIKAALEPESQAVDHWEDEATAFALDLRDRYVPSMRQRIDIQAQWKGALERTVKRKRLRDSVAASAMPERCPYSLKDIVGDDFQFEDAVRKLQQPRSSG